MASSAGDKSGHQLLLVSSEPTTSSQTHQGQQQQHHQPAVKNGAMPHDDSFAAFPAFDHNYFAPDLISQIFSAAIFRKPVTIREKIHHFMHSPLCQMIIIVFVILDCLVVFAQLYVDLQNEKQLYAQLEAQCGRSNLTHHEMEDLESTILAYETAFEALHYTSMVLISMFFVEVLVKMITGWHHFVSSILEIMDACIVIISFGLDVMLLFEEVSVIIESIAQLLILLRLWRIARIVNGAAVAMDSKWRTKYQALQDRYRTLQTELAEYRGEPPPTHDEHHQHHENHHDEKHQAEKHL